MKIWSTALTAVACLLGGGCRTDPAIVLLERENRLLEDEVYRLRGVIEDYQQGLMPSCGEFLEGEMLCTEPASKVPGDGGRGTSAARTLNEDETEHSLTAPDVVRPSEPEPPGALPEIFSRPAGEPSRRHEGSRPPPRSPAPLGKPDLGASDSRIFPLPPSEKRFPAAPRPPDEVKLASAEEPILFEDSRQASAIKLYRDMTGGYDLDEEPGDEGIQVVFEIQDRQGRSLFAPADVSMVLFDPLEEGEVEGEAARIARWDFPVETTADLFRTDGRRRALFLEAPWPDDAPPKHNQLQLFVRYTTWDGRNLQTGQPIEITLPGQRKVRDRAAKSREEESSLATIEKSDESSANEMSDQSHAEPQRPGSSLTAALPHPPRTASR